MKRVGVLHGGIRLAVDDKFVSPAQRLKIAKYAELSSSAYSDLEDGEGLLG
jgi:stearoyl-CoA desaturase (delta-9 desaturase)